MKATLFPLTFLALFIVSCENEINQPIDLSNKNLLKKEIYGTEQFKEYFYNDKARISKIESYSESKLEMKTEYFYNEQGLLVKENFYNTYSGVPITSYYSYEYDNDNLLNKTSTFLLMPDGNYEFRSYNKYEYDSHNRIVRKTLYGTDDSSRSFWQYIYDSFDNLAIIHFYQNGGPSFHYTYLYDNKNNPLEKLDNKLTAANLSHNNVIMRTDSISTGQVSNYEFNYEYNKNGFPIGYTYQSSNVIYEYY